MLCSNEPLNDRQLLIPISVSAGDELVSDESNGNKVTSLLISWSSEVKRSLMRSMLVITTDVSLQ